jgi:STE24 endopeptidase
LNESKATRYQRLRRRAQFVSVAAGAGLLVGVSVTPAAGWLAQWSAAAAGAWPVVLQPTVTLCVFVVVLALAAELVALPASWLAAAAVTRRATLPAQVRDALVGTGLALGVAVVVRLAVWASPRWWWALAGVALAGGMLLVARALAAGLNASGAARPLTRPLLLERLATLATRAVGRPVEVREWASDSSVGATAVVTGVGRTGRVWLSEEIARDWADDEIEVVVAHELSHHAHHDLVRKATLDAFAWGLAFWSADRLVPAADVSALPLLAVVAGGVWVLVRPVRMAQSRAHERRADRFALTLTGNVEAFSRALKRLGAQHLAEERPSRLTRWFFHAHPTVEARLTAARRMAQGPVR